MTDLRVEFFAERNATDAKCLVESRFASGTSAAIDHILQMPWRPQGEHTGILLYEDGTPVCFRALIARHYYFNQRPLVGVMGSMLCKRLGATSDCVREVMRRTTGPFPLSCGETDLYLTNSAVPRNIMLHKELGIANSTDPSWILASIALIRPIAYLGYMLCRKILRKDPMAGLAINEQSLLGFGVCKDKFSISAHQEVSERDVSTFWEAYLKQNRGLVASRTPVELDWMYGARLRAGEAVVLTCDGAQGMVGYLILVTDKSHGLRWYVADMIALGNDLRVLSLLLKSAKIFLRRCTPAVTCMIVGFPALIQRLIRRWRTFARMRDCSSLIYKVHEVELSAQIQCSLSRNEGWAFCPYDGDLYL